MTMPGIYIKPDQLLLATASCCVHAMMSQLSFSRSYFLLEGILDELLYPRTFPSFFVLDGELLHTVAMNGTMPAPYLADFCLSKVEVAVNHLTPSEQIFPNVIKVYSSIYRSYVPLHAQQSLAWLSLFASSHRSITTMLFAHV